MIVLQDPRNVNPILDLDLSSTETITLDFKAKFGLLQELARLPMPTEDKHIHAFSMLTYLNLSAIQADVFLRWSSRFFLPKLRKVQGYTGDRVSWSILVATMKGELGIRSVEELRLAPSIDLNSLQNPLLQTTRRLRLSMLEQSRIPMNMPARTRYTTEYMQMVALSRFQGLLTPDPSRVPFRNLETLVIDCGAFEPEAIRKVLEGAQDMLLENRRVLGVPLKGVLYEANIGN
jgi:hypothetical protein